MDLRVFGHFGYSCLTDLLSQWRPDVREYHKRTGAMEERAGSPADETSNTHSIQNEVACTCAVLLNWM